MDKDQTFVGLSSEDEELLNQKLPEVSATSRTEQEAEKKVVYLVKLIGPLQDLLAIKIIMVKYTKKKKLQLLLLIGLLDSKLYPQAYK